MSRLQNLLLEAKAGLEPRERISSSKLSTIAMLCGTSELAEIQDRINALRIELTTVEDWDGDTQDDIHLAIEFFNKLAGMVGNNFA
ncbi:hypothetical protein ASE26_27400 [Duganella sp. Root198D2]|nr:hypothetical protein ASD07_25105 [Duganella sp. Root336D2]KRB93892.1 hypothetical protein ASE26_27400 [Duganella sp. Root198D2]